MMGSMLMLRRGVFWVKVVFWAFEMEVDFLTLHGASGWRYRIELQQHVQKG